MRLNNGLLTEVGFFRQVRINGSKGAIRDGSAFEFQLSEIIALGAAEIAVVSSPMTEEFINLIPASFRNRVILIDKNRSSEKKALSFFKPITNELSIQLMHGFAGYSVQKKTRRLRN